jgi:hypothetical protein
LVTPTVNVSGGGGGATTASCFPSTGFGGGAAFGGEKEQLQLQKICFKRSFEKQLFLLSILFHDGAFHST